MLHAHPDRAERRTRHRLLFAEDGDYYFLNCSKSAGKRVSITFPAIMPNLGPETVLVNGNGGRAKVTAAFSKTASSDNSHIEITAGGGGTVSSDLGADDSFQVACSGNRVPVDGNFHDIGSYLQVALNGSNVTLKGIESKIKSIASLSVKGSGDTETIIALHSVFTVKVQKSDQPEYFQYLVVHVD
ncbi:MAG: hypothetical protein RR728_08545, partial [Oscillospiraceae bacterium]